MHVGKRREGRGEDGGEGERERGERERERNQGLPVQPQEVTQVCWGLCCFQAIDRFPCLHPSAAKLVQNPLPIVYSPVHYKYMYYSIPTDNEKSLLMKQGKGARL